MAEKCTVCSLIKVISDIDKIQNNEEMLKSAVTYWKSSWHWGFY